MRQSKLFTKTRREAPSDETAKNAQLLIRAGYVHKEMAGVYDYLPLGLRVLENLKRIVREEMNAIGGQEFIMTSLQRKDVWETTDRWDDKKVDVWFKSALKNGTEVGFGWSHEEPITDMMKQYLESYRDLPAYVFQFQTKLRNELRAKSGIMRGREFVMKDMYSYTANATEHVKFYEAAIKAYHRVFERVGLGDRTFLTVASGGSFTDFSHEFQTLSDIGEDTVYVDRHKKLAVNAEVLSDDVLAKVGLSRSELEEQKSIEVGNIFDFGGIKSEQLGLKYTNEDGKDIPVHLGSYGIGITRLMGAIVELFADDKGIVWPDEVAPFQYHLLSLMPDNADAVAFADDLYDTLTKAGKMVLYDDRNARAGEKFADSDLMGIPWRLNIGKQALESGKIEKISRKTGEMTLASVSEILGK